MYFYKFDSTTGMPILAELILNDINQFNLDKYLLEGDILQYSKSINKFIIQRSGHLLPVADKYTNVPPTSPTDGMKVLITDLNNTPATDEFEGHDNKLAIYNLDATSWIFIDISKNDMIMVNNNKNDILVKEMLIFNGVNWSSMTLHSTNIRVVPNSPKYTSTDLNGYLNQLSSDVITLSDTMSLIITPHINDSSIHSPLNDGITSNNTLWSSIKTNSLLESINSSLTMMVKDLNMVYNLQKIYHNPFMDESLMDESLMDESTIKEISEVFLDLTQYRYFDILLSYDINIIFTDNFDSNPLFLNRDKAISCIVKLRQDVEGNRSIDFDGMNDIIWMTNDGEMPIFDTSPLKIYTILFHFIPDESQGYLCYAKVIDGMDNEIPENPEIKNPKLTGISTIEAFREKTITADSTDTYTINLDISSVFNIKLTDDCLFNIIGTLWPETTASFTLALTQDSVGNRVVEFPANIKWEDDTPPEMSMDANTTTVFVFFTMDGGNTFLGFRSGKGFLLTT